MSSRPHPRGRGRGGLGQGVLLRRGLRCRRRRRCARRHRQRRFHRDRRGRRLFRLRLREAALHRRFRLGHRLALQLVDRLLQHEVVRRAEFDRLALAILLPLFRRLLVVLLFELTQLVHALLLAHLLLLLLVRILRVREVVRVVHFARDERVVRIAVRILIDRQVRANALVLDRAAARRVVVRGREAQRGVGGHRAHGLHRALAERRLAENDRAVLILQRARDDLRRRRGVRVRQHDDRQRLEDRRHALQRIAVERRQAIVLVGVAIDLLRVRDLAVRRHDDRVRRQERARDADRALQQAAAIVAQVDDQALQVRLLTRDVLQLRGEVGHRALLEARDAHITDAGLHHLRLHALHADDRARDGERERAVVGLAEDRQRDLRARIAAHLLDRLVERHAAHRLVVDARDEVARTDAGAERGRVLDRRDDLDEPIFRRDLDAETREAALRLLLQFLVVGLVEIRRVRIEARHHALDRGGEKLLVVDRRYVFMLDLPEYFGEEPQLVEWQRLGGGLLGRRGKLQGCKCAGSKARGDQADVFQVLSHKVCCGRRARGSVIGGEERRTSITAHLS